MGAACELVVSDGITGGSDGSSVVDDALLPRLVLSIVVPLAFVFPAVVALAGLVVGVPLGVVPAIVVVVIPFLEVLGVSLAVRLIV